MGPSTPQRTDANAIRPRSDVENLKAPPLSPAGELPQEIRLIPTGDPTKSVRSRSPYGHVGVGGRTASTRAWLHRR
jgi:hypothetical protein